MRWIVRILGGLVLLIVVVVLGVFTVARFHDGPFDGGLAVVSGGAFVTGEMQSGPAEPDWTLQEQNREVVTHTAGEYKQMPDPVTPGVPAVEEEEHDSRGVENATR